MTRTLKGFAAAGVLALSGSLFAQTTAPEIAFDSDRRPAQDARQRVRRRGRRRRTEFEGADLRLHADRSSRTRHSATTGRSTGTARASISSTRPASTSASSGRTSTGSTRPSGCASIRRTTSGRSTRARIRWSSSTAKGAWPSCSDGSLKRSPSGPVLPPGAPAPAAGAGADARSAGGARRAAPAEAGEPGGRRWWRRQGRRAGRTSRSRHAGLDVQPPVGRGLGQGRQHLHCGWHERQREPHREVRPRRQLHQAVGLDRLRAGAVQRAEGARRGRAGQRLRRSTPATSASRCSTATATSSRSSPTSARRSRCA